MTESSGKNYYIQWTIRYQEGAAVRLGVYLSDRAFVCIVQDVGFDIQYCP
jgi:hypothetical protein